MTNTKKTRKNLSSAKRVVVKIGTNCLTDEDSKLDEKSIEKLTADIADLKEDGKEIILVSSGAIGAGLGRLSFQKTPDDMESLQAASTVGQGTLMRKYSELFEKYEIHVAQILLTQEDLTDPNRFQNFKNTIKTLFKWGVIPIVNENDAVAVEEIRMGDNDPLSAFTASGAGADLLVMLTDVDGLHTGDPKKEESAKPIRTVEEITPETENLTEKTSGRNFGGMYTKIQAAKIATSEGIPVVVADAGESGVLKKILSGKEIGTLFLAQK